MKKNIKKIITTSSILSMGLVSVGTVIGGTIYSTKSDNVQNINSKLMKSSVDSSIIFNNKKYNSIEEAVADYEKTNASVETYIGDIYKESSASYNYRKIYLNKNEVQKYDSSKIKVAYSTSYGKSTMDPNVSKKSYIDQPINAWKDKVGNIHYSEKDAINSNASQMAFNSMAFYEINDYSNSSVNPKKVKINPLNKNDISELKKLALLNIGKSKSLFSTSYFYANEGPSSYSTKYKEATKPGEYIFLDQNNKATMDKVIYTINFNGVPLYKINHDWISDNFFSERYFDIVDKKFYGGHLYEEMKKDPAKHLTDYIVSKLNQSSTYAVKEFFEKLSNNLENISNNFKIDEQGNLYLEKIVGQTFNRNDLMINFISKESKNEQFKDKFLDDTKYSQLGISEDEINKGLKGTINDDDSLLFSNTGTFKSINEYNKALNQIINSYDQLPNKVVETINANMVTNPSDIVFLYGKNNVPFEIKYNEYASQNIYFNESVNNNNNISLISSVEQKNKYIESNSSNSIEIIWLVYDRRGGLLSTSFDRQNAIENAINVAKPEVDEEFVYYNKDNNFIKIKNQINELNVLNLDGESYGFVTYQELYNCLYEYIKMSSTQNDGNIPPAIQENLPFQPNDIQASDIASVISGFSSLEDVNKLSPEDKYKKFGKAFKITSYASWDRFIGNGLVFNEKPKSRLSLHNSKNNGTLTEIKIAVMTVTLQNGYKFSDGTNVLTQDVEYTPNSSLTPDGTIDGKNTYSSTKDIIITTSIVVGVIILLEVIVLITTILNKRSNSSHELKTLREYYKLKK